MSITSVFNKMFSGVKALGGKIQATFNQVAKIAAWIACLKAFFELVGASLKYAIVDIGGWLFAGGGLFSWIGAYFKCGLDKLGSFSNCFLWYALDTMGAIAYLPFRFVFWLMDEIFQIGIQKVVHDLWCILEDIDKFIHDPEPEGMGTGFHILHFPDSVNKKCYSCGIGEFPRLPDPREFNRAVNNYNKVCFGKGGTCKKCDGKSWFKRDATTAPKVVKKCISRAAKRMIALNQSKTERQIRDTEMKKMAIQQELNKPQVKNNPALKSNYERKLKIIDVTLVNLYAKLAQEKNAQPQPQSQ